MYRKAMSCLVVINVLFLFGFLCIKGIEKNRAMALPVREVKLEETMLADQESSALGIACVAASGQRIVDCNVLEKQWQYPFSPEECEVLCRIVEAEAEGEDEDGKLLVANVVLNRVKNDKFPDTISEVVFQRSGNVTQFSPVASGRYYRVKISEETRRAVERALEGEDISNGALFFAARKYADDSKMRWFDEKLTMLFRHGGHEFFK